MKKIDEILELENELQRTGATIRDAALLCEVEWRSVYRWLDGQNAPGPVFRRLIHKGLKRLRHLPSVPVGIFADRDFYRILQKKITLEQKNWLLGAPTYEEYRLRLRKLLDEQNAI